MPVPLAAAALPAALVLVLGGSAPVAPVAHGGPLAGAPGAPTPPAAVPQVARQAPDGWHGTRYGWPTGDPADVVRPFDLPSVRWGAGHRGVDLRATPGAPIRAAADGLVAFAGPVGGRPVIAVVHPDGIRTSYEPVEPAVARGDRVSAGDVLGTLVDDGAHCPGCVHWGARRGSAYVDPLRLLRDRVRLYPLEG